MVSLELVVKNGDKGDREGARSEDEKHEVRNSKRGGVGVDTGGVSAEIVRVKEAVAEDTEEGRDEGGGGKKNGGGFNGKFGVSQSDDGLKLFLLLGHKRIISRFKDSF